jgi:hypothetical protein
MTLIDIKEKREFNKATNLGNHAGKGKGGGVKELFLILIQWAMVNFNF